MFKMKKKIFLGLFLILILVANMSFASYSTVQMSVVEEPVATIEFGSNSKFEKKLISKDLTNKEVTLQLQVNNGEASKKPTGEIVLVLDNSDSMNNEITTTNGKTTRKQLIFDSAKTVITNLLKDNKDLKISVVSFSTNTTASKEGTTEDATLVSGLSNSSSVLTNAIDSIEANGPRTDLEAGLDLASKQFSSTATNKYMIVLTDGVPNVSLGHNNPYYSNDTINATKAKLQAIEKQNIKLFTMLSGISDESYVPSGTTKTFGEIINEVFGTTKTPTAGTFYYVSDDKIEETVTTIYNSLMPISQSYKNIQIVDYFPKEIIDNYLASGSGFANGKYRIYEQLQKSLSLKENADFLKKEYGTGGGTYAGGVSDYNYDCDAKGVRIRKGYEENAPEIRMNWTEVAKEIGRLISDDRYLNKKEWWNYPEWLAEQEVKRTRVAEQVKNREVMSTVPAEKEPEEQEMPQDVEYEYDSNNFDKDH